MSKSKKDDESQATTLINRNLIDQQIEAASASADLLEQARQHRAPTLAQLEQAAALIRTLIGLKYIDADERMDEALSRLDCDIDDLKYKYTNT